VSGFSEIETQSRWVVGTCGDSDLLKGREDADPFFDEISVRTNTPSVFSGGAMWLVVGSIKVDSH
jgi:hypothetical protein